MQLESSRTLQNCISDVLHCLVKGRTDRLLFPPPPSTKVTVGVFSIEKSHYLVVMNDQLDHVLFIVASYSLTPTTYRLVVGGTTYHLLERGRYYCLWRNYESGCLCLSARWCLVSSAHSQPCLSFIAHVLYRRRSGNTWYNKDKEREGQWPRWNITINSHYTAYHLPSRW
jgi:hypothetical protein